VTRAGVGSNTIYTLPPKRGACRGTTGDGHVRRVVATWPVGMSVPSGQRNTDPASCARAGTPCGACTVPGPLRRAGSQPPTVPGDPPGHRLHHGGGHVHAGTMPAHSSRAPARRSGDTDQVVNPGEKTSLLPPVVFTAGVPGRGATGKNRFRV
jgi:hypothetical protein